MADIDIAIEVLSDCERYFDDRADASAEGDPPEYKPNREMVLHSQVQMAIDALERVKRGEG